MGEPPRVLGPGGRMLARRQTAPSFLASRVSIPNVSSIGGSATLIPLGGPGTSISRNYMNASGQRSLSMNRTGSLRVKTRPNPSANMSIRVKKRNESFGGPMSPIHRPHLKLLKVVLAGSDLLVSHAAKAYGYLRSEEPNLFSGLDVRFYHIPLSRASSANGLIPDLNASSNPDLPEPISEQLDRSGNDVHIGRFLAHMDSWYERNVMLAVHNTLRLLPNVSHCISHIWDSSCMQLHHCDIMLHLGIPPCRMCSQKSSKACSSP